MGLDIEPKAIMGVVKKAHSPNTSFAYATNKHNSISITQWNTVLYEHAVVLHIQSTKQ